MVTIDLVAVCDQCEAEERQSTRYVINNVPMLTTFIRGLRGKGWTLARDESYRLTHTLCPKCSKQKVTHV